jgi:phosphoheptose isomerase
LPTKEKLTLVARNGRRGQVKQLPNAFTETYKAVLMNAIRGVDLVKVSRAIELFIDARARGRRIFVCGSGSAAVMGAKLLCEIMKNANAGHQMRFRVMMLDDQKPIPIDTGVEDVEAEQSFVDQLKTHAEPGDLVVGLSSRKTFLDVLRALGYAEWIGCHTIAITRPSSKAKPKPASHVAIELHLADQGAIEAIQLVLCHMIGRYFIQSQ